MNIGKIISEMNIFIQKRTEYAYQYATSLEKRTAELFLMHPDAVDYKENFNEKGPHIRLGGRLSIRYNGRFFNVIMIDEKEMNIILKYWETDNEEYPTSKDNFMMIEPDDFFGNQRLFKAMKLFFIGTGLEEKYESILKDTEKELADKFDFDEVYLIEGPDELNKALHEAIKEAFGQNKDRKYKYMMFPEGISVTYRGKKFNCILAEKGNDLYFVYLRPTYRGYEIEHYKEEDKYSFNKKMKEVYDDYVILEKESLMDYMIDPRETRCVLFGLEQIQNTFGNLEKIDIFNNMYDREFKEI